MELLAGVVHRGGRAPEHAALGLSVEDLLPAERRDSYWRHLCSERWPGGVYPECNHDAAAEDYHKRLYLTYRTIDLLQSPEVGALAQVVTTLSPYVSYCKFNSGDAVRRAPFKLLEHVEVLIAGSCRMGSRPPEGDKPDDDPLANLTNALATGLPCLERLDLSRNSMVDSDVLWVCSVLRARQPSIRYLDLTWNRMTDKSLVDGVLCLISETSITQMKLGFNDTSPAGRALCTRAVEQRNRQPGSSRRPNIGVSFI